MPHEKKSVKRSFFVVVGGALGVRSACILHTPVCRFRTHKTICMMELTRLEPEYCEAPELVFSTVGTNSNSSMDLGSHSAGRRTHSQNIIETGSIGGAFAGWGAQRVILLNVLKNKELTVAADTNGLEDKIPVVPTQEAKHHGLSLLYSTSIAGCDLMSSCLYTAGLCINVAGKVPA